MILYQVIQCRRIKTAAGAVAVARHNLRQNEALGEYIDPENTKYNTYHGVTSYDRFSGYYNAVLEQAALKRKPQKNASRVVEFVVSTSHEYCSDWKTNSASKEKLDEYFTESEAFIAERYGRVILSSAVHYDETTPHLHVLCIPLYRNPQTNAISFSSSHFIGGITELRQLHTDFYEQVGKTFGLTRGIEGARTKHQDLKQYKKWEAEQKKQLAHQRFEVAEQQFELSEKDSKLAVREKEIAGQNAAVDSREHRVAERESVVQGKEHAYKSYEKKAFSMGPVLPDLPMFTSSDERQSWQQHAQRLVAQAFLQVKVKYDKLVAKFNSLLKAYRESRQNETHWKERAEKAEHDLETKPLEDIRTERQRRRSRSYEDWSW